MVHYISLIYYPNTIDKIKMFAGMGKWNDGRTLNLIDPILKRVVSRSDILIRCFHIGLLCVQESVADRPTMASVIMMISNDFFLLKNNINYIFYIKFLGKIIF